jgi:DNA-binding transcriptional LysR family regulator
MHPDQIATFLDLAESRSFHRTAERQGLTQSTVSARIAALESALGTALFSRSRAGATLTTEGLKFAPHARALRHAMEEARRSVTPTGTAALSLRLGIQNDLAAGRLGDWVMGFRKALPEVAFYIEPDYSAQMCRDLAAGVLDFAVLYTPHADPDLHFTSLGEIRHRLISSDGDRLSALAPERMVRGNYSAALAAAQAQVLPQMAEAPLAAGQAAAVAVLLDRLGGSAYLPDHAAAPLLASGRFQRVTDAAPIGQPVFAAVPLRHRTAQRHRALLTVVQAQMPRS